MPAEDPAIRLDRNLSYNLSLLTFLMGKASFEIYNSRDLTAGQWKVLSVLAAFGPMAAREIGRRVTLDKAAISRAVRQLRDLDLADYRSHALDGRSVEVVLTAKGKRKYRAMNDEIMALQAQLFDGLTKEQQRTFFVVADHLLRQLRSDSPATPERLVAIN